jgi:hypothetical protein
MSILIDKPHDFICLATADTKHSQCSQNVFNFVHNYKALSHFPHDELDRNFYLIFGYITIQEQYS